jgi:biopolymer transport protein ExbD
MDAFRRCVLCEASNKACEKIRSDTQQSVVQVARMMAGDPSVSCRVNGAAMKCGTEPKRKQTSQQIYVEVGDDGNCGIDSVSTPCPEVGKKIRGKHPADDPRVAVCGGAKVTYDSMRSVLGALSEESLPASFGCPPH